MIKDSSLTTRRLKWVFGTTYFVQGSSTLVEIPTLYFIKFFLGLGDAGGQFFHAARTVGWLLKPLWGFISDKFPVFGYRRKSWFILMTCLSIFFWALNATCVFLGIRFPPIYLAGFILAFTTYAFVDVVGDALMVEHGRKLRQVGSFVNFQWTMFALSNAAAAALSGWLQEKVQAGDYSYGWIFFITGFPPLLTAVVGFRNIDEDRLPSAKTKRFDWRRPWKRLTRKTIRPVKFAFNSIARARKENEVMVYLVLFIVLWNFRPSIGYIERSYLIDVREFDPTIFATVFTIQAFTFLASILTYRWIIKKWKSLQWHHYLYAMAAFMLIAFPLNFFMLLDPQHAWWKPLDALFAPSWELIPAWNRYHWFRILFSVFFGFATIPAFIIPLRIAGEAVKLASAGMSYAFLTALANATNLIEGIIGSGLYLFFSQPWFSVFLDAFNRSIFNVAGVADQRTLILQLFVYIGVFFTLLTIPLVHLLRIAFARHEVQIADVQPDV